MLCVKSWQRVVCSGVVMNDFSFFNMMIHHHHHHHHVLTPTQSLHAERDHMLVSGWFWLDQSLRWSLIYSTVWKHEPFFMFLYCASRESGFFVIFFFFLKLSNSSTGFWTFWTVAAFPVQSLYPTIFKGVFYCLFVKPLKTKLHIT